MVLKKKSDLCNIALPISIAYICILIPISYYLFPNGTEFKLPLGIEFNLKFSSLLIISLISTIVVYILTYLIIKTLNSILIRATKKNQMIKKGFIIVKKIIMEETINYDNLKNDLIALETYKYLVSYTKRKIKNDGNEKEKS